ncbi:ABC transporter ATP-binding protein [Paenibacillus sp. GP183]|jgi:ABC-2 type transport system ATP-binding protein|uniref:ABC transporter ATP-binding protein n=1 Tax=Paenibacillus sp. GP183 TaxID=1882751 RepID=UPI000896A6D1|nr:ABC transporter ATP-binding protein [Paenibacillus sp. GP183]SEB43411.1 ABC-2 type transport system ATP-binding protein [Paenibacillus sp. GP183]
MTLQTSIRVLQINKQFGEKTVLQDINLQVQKAEIFGLLGPSGSGKTTLVRLIAGIDDPTSGEVYVLDQRMPQLGMMSRIGYMAQSDALYAELTAQENMEFFASLYGLSGAKRKRRIHEVMELVGLTDHLKKQVSSYSGGMKRRLSLAISLIHEPGILILDEPTVGIDPVLRKSIWMELEKLSSQGTTILLTTHVMDEADKCHRLGMIRDGALIAVGSPHELKLATSSPTIEEAFLYYGGVRS